MFWNWEIAFRRSTGWLTGKHDHIAVWIAEPHLSLSRVRIVDVGFFKNVGAQRTSASDRGIEIAHLKPEQDTVPWWRCVRVDEVRMIFLIPGMQLKNQVSIAKHPVISVAVLMLGK